MRKQTLLPIVAAGLATGGSLPNYSSDLEYNPKRWSKSNLTKAQIRRRKKSNNAKKARAKNRR